MNDENGTFQAWKKLFSEKDENFSGWVQEKLLEELSRQLDPSFIHNKLAELENKKSYWETQLLKSKEMQQAKEQKIQEDIEPEKPLGKQIDITSRKIGMYLQYQFTCETLPASNVWEFIAIEYLKLETRPPLIEFLASKGYKKRGAQ